MKEPRQEEFQQYLSKQRVQLPDNLRALEILNQYFPQRGRLLEIGSYLGIFLDRIRSTGWDVTGLEPFHTVAEYSRKNYNLNVVGKLLPEAKFPDNSFDAVIMLHVIEHLPNPSEYIREIRRIIKSGGMLVVETPRFDSLMFKVMGRRERSLSNCDGHIYFFTVPSLSALLERNGFKVERVDLVGRTLTADRFLYNVGVMSRSSGIQKMLARAGAAVGLNKLKLHVNVRDMQRIYCRAK
jgi:SAM-dependent methyltransferase